MKEVAKYKQCFVCGDENSHGLKARFFVREDGAVISEYKVDQRFVGNNSAFRCTCGTGSVNYISAVIGRNPAIRIFFTFPGNKVPL